MSLAATGLDVSSTLASEVATYSGQTEMKLTDLSTGVGTLHDFFYTLTIVCVVTSVLETSAISPATALITVYSPALTVTLAIF